MMHHRTTRLLFVGLFALLVVPAAPTAAITGGEPDGDAHPYVGLLIGEGIDGASCSGTLLSPTVFLSAGHCTILLAQFGVPVYVTFDDTPGADSTYYAVAELHTHPDFCLECAPGQPGFDAYDVGVAILAEPANLGEFGQLPTAGQSEGLQGQTVTVVGYGVQGFEMGGGWPAWGAVGTRYAATVSIVSTEHRIGDLFLKLWAHHGGTCFHDFGGPALVGDVVLTANSFVMNNLCRGVFFAQRIDLPEILTWLDDYV